MVWPNIRRLKPGKMKPPLKAPKIFSPFFFVVLFVLANLYYCLGCDNKQGGKIGDNAPDISANDIHGKYFSLSKLKGKVVVIYFWTNSCCGTNLKQLEPLYRQYKNNGLEILAINELDSKNVVESFARNNALTFTMLTDEKSMLFKHYEAFGFPTILILDGRGVIRNKILGDMQVENLQKLVVRQFNIQKEIDANYQKNHPS